LQPFVIEFDWFIDCRVAVELLQCTGSSGSEPVPERLAMDLAHALEQYAEAELLARVAQQDSEAFSCFYDRTAGVLFAVAKSIVGETSLAEDVLQEVYLQIWEKAAVFDPTVGKPISWAIALTRNRALDKLRSARRREAGVRRLEAVWIDQPASDATDGFDRQEIATAIASAMKKLDSNKREAIQLAFFHGLPHAEVAEVMKQPLGTVKAWIRRGMLELRTELSNASIL
jgi:RNA polymerase sigma-70 factor (ECF subfamily)